LPGSWYLPPFAALDLGHPARRHAHGLGELGLGQAVALAFLGEPVAALRVIMQILRH
jgi:hypothetical protein